MLWRCRILFPSHPVPSRVILWSLSQSEGEFTLCRLRVSFYMQIGCNRRGMSERLAATTDDREYTTQYTPPPSNIRQQEQEFLLLLLHVETLWCVCTERAWLDVSFRDALLHAISNEAAAAASVSFLFYSINSNGNSFQSLEVFVLLHCGSQANRLTKRLSSLFFFLSFLSKYEKKNLMAYCRDPNRSV